MPAGIIGVGFGEALADRQGVAVGLQCLGQVPLGDLHVADLVVREREVALPAGISGVGFGETLADRQEHRAPGPSNSNSAHVTHRPTSDPLPLPTSLVVKKGSNTRSTTS